MKRKKITVVIDKELATLLDLTQKQHHCSKSVIVRVALRNFFNTETLC